MTRKTLIPISQKRVQKQKSENAPGRGSAIDTPFLFAYLLTEYAEINTDFSSENAAIVLKSRKRVKRMFCRTKTPVDTLKLLYFQPDLVTPL